MNLEGRRVGYVPYSSDMSYAGDRRRFPYYARRRGIDFEPARSHGDYDVVVLSSRADITAWARHPPGPRLVYELIESYLALPDRTPRACCGARPSSWPGRSVVR